MAIKKKEGHLAENRKARFNYTVEETLECGIALQGTEVKSIKAGHLSFQDSVITSYSIHYTKLYDSLMVALVPPNYVWIRKMRDSILRPIPKRRQPFDESTGWTA